MVISVEINKKIEKIIIYAVEIIFIFILSFLTIESMFRSCSITSSETTTYLFDNPIIHIITISITIFIFSKINKIKKDIDKKIVIGLVCIWGLISAIWIFMSNLYPRADQRDIYNIILQMKKGIFDSFEIGKYMVANPHQLGLLLYEYIFSFIFGVKNYLGLQLINVVALFITYFSIYKLTTYMFKDKKTSICTLIGLFLFIPMWFYITFIYGNIIGLMFSMISLVFILKYLEKNKIVYLITASICIGLAIMLKSNYLIMLIAMVCIIILDMISNKKINNIGIIIALILGYLVMKILVPIIAFEITGKEKVKGIPMLAYVEMGIQEGTRAPGWYNGYNRKVYANNKYDYEKTTIQVKKDIKESISNFKNNPKYTVEFFYKKVVSQWNNPTFQCFWIGRGTKDAEGKVKPAIVRAINGNGKTNKILFEYTNIIQTIILFGATICILINFKEINGKQLVFAVMFIGGFLFHIVWEAKCQYTISYFILLIPYSIRGYLQLSKMIQEFLNNKYKKLIK